MAQSIETDNTTSPDTSTRHRRDRRRRLEAIEQPHTAKRKPADGGDTGPVTAGGDSTPSRVIAVRNGHRTMGLARGRQLQTSLIFQALLVLALVLSIVAIVQYRATPADGSPDDEPPSVLFQVDE